MKILDEKHFYKIDGLMVLALNDLSKAVQKGNVNEICLICGQIAEKVENCKFDEVK